MNLRERLRELRASGRLVRYGLVASLALNLLVAGIFVGAVAKPDGHHRGWNSSGLAVRPLIDALPDAGRKALRSRLRELRRDGPDKARRLAQDSVDALAAAIEADPYSEEAVISAFETQRSSFGQLAEEGHAVIAGVIGGLSLDERVEVVREFRENLESRRLLPPGVREQADQ